MDPNSANQRWSTWTVRVTLALNPAHQTPAFFDSIREDAKRFLTALFGTAGRARVRLEREGINEVWVIEVLTEGVDVHCPLKRRDITDRLSRHYMRGFGRSASVAVINALVAGTREDGSPAEQLVILPTIVDEEAEQEARDGALRALRG